MKPFMITLNVSNGISILQKKKKKNKQIISKFKKKYTEQRFDDGSSLETHHTTIYINYH